MLKIGVIGLGKMGMLHMINATRFRNVVIVAAADASKKRLHNAAVLGAKNLFSDFRELLELDLDAVIISLPNFLHRESIELALENGMNVFVEKPMARTTEECRSIVNAVEKSGRKLMVGHCMRFFDMVREMKGTLDNGNLGQLENVTLENIVSGPFSYGDIPQPVPEWWFDPEKVGGGALLDIGYHLIDLYRFFAGDCHLLSSHLKHKFNMPVEDTAIAVVQSDKSSSSGIIHVGWYQQMVLSRNDMRVILHGDYAYISSEQFEPSNVYAYAIKEGVKNVFRKIGGRRIRPLTFSQHLDAYEQELKHFFNCLEKDLEPSVTAIDGLRTLEVIEEAYRRDKRVIVGD